MLRSLSIPLAVASVGLALLSASAVYADLCGQSTSGPDKVCIPCDCMNAVAPNDCKKSGNGLPTAPQGKCYKPTAGPASLYMACFAASGDHTCTEVYDNPPSTCTISRCNCTAVPPPGTGFVCDVNSCVVYKTVAIPKTCTSN